MGQHLKRADGVVLSWVKMARPARLRHFDELFDVAFPTIAEH
jgi:hypothetical protein